MANFVWTCGLCRREASARFEPSFPTKPYSSENEQLEPFLTMDCRNLEFIGFDPRVRHSLFVDRTLIRPFRLQGVWKCVGVDSGTVFDEVDLSEEWTDYDEKVSRLPSSRFLCEASWLTAFSGSAAGGCLPRGRRVV
jgi:hypothetical protein